MPGRRRSSGLATSGLELDISGGGVDLGIDGRDMAFDDLTRKRIGGHPYSESRLDLCQLLLRQAEIDEYRVDRLERHDRVALFKVLTKIYVTDPESAAKRCADVFFRDHRADVVGLSLCLFVLRVGIIVF